MTILKILLNMMDFSSARLPAHIMTYLSYYFVIKSRRMRWVGHVACVEEMRNGYNILVGKLGRPRQR
jgi:hypothetical protein